MIIKLFDKKEFYVTKEEAEQVKQAIDSGADHIEIGNDWIRCSAIATILEGGEPKPISNLLDRPDYRGQFSPALEELKKKYGKHKPVDKHLT
jgi:hypothetical protein